jgi:hypothetical protein
MPDTRALYLTYLSRHPTAALSKNCPNSVLGERSGVLAGRALRGFFTENPRLRVAPGKRLIGAEYRDSRPVRGSGPR